MYLRFRQDGDSEETLYEFRPDKTPWKMAVVAERLYSKACGERRTWEQLKADAQQGSITARKVALWLAMTKQHPMLRFDDIPDFETGELTMEYSKEELRRMRDGLVKSDMLLEGEKAAVLEQLDRDIEVAPIGSDEPDPAADPEVEEPEAGKADEPVTGELSTNFETSTG